VQLCEANHPAGQQPDTRNALALSPPATTVGPPQPRSISDPRAGGDRLDLLDVAKDLEVYST
jgi:hypothetical protein